jgi:hypothetical protein
MLSQQANGSSATVYAGWLLGVIALAVFVVILHRELWQKGACRSKRTTPAIAPSSSLPTLKS